MGRSSLSRFAIERAMQPRTDTSGQPDRSDRPDAGKGHGARPALARQQARHADRHAAPPHRGAGHVRIVGGQWRRRLVPVPTGPQMPPGLRPTPDRVRETLFNWIGQDLSGWRGLDVCAGTGVLALEALSRGAQHVILAEKNLHLLRHLQQISQDWGIAAHTLQLHDGDGLALLHALARSHAAGLDVIWLDPPFDATWHEQALRAARVLIKPNGWLYLEAGRVFAADELAALGWRMHRYLKAGMVHAHLLAPVLDGMD